jgi:hypothetical protein
MKKFIQYNIKIRILYRNTELMKALKHCRSSGCKLKYSEEKSDSATETKDCHFNSGCLKVPCRLKPARD